MASGRRIWYNDSGRKAEYQNTEVYHYMKKIFALILAAAMLLGCVVLAEEEAAPQTGKYVLENNTGDDIVFVSIADNEGGEPKSFEYAEGEFVNGEAKLFTFDIPAGESGDHRLSLTFRTKGGFEKTFATLSIEEVLISLNSEADVVSGATPFGFSYNPYPQVGHYTLQNNTGETVTKITVSDNNSDLKLEIACSLGEKEIRDLYFCIPADANGDHALTLSYTTESGEERSFATLSIEEAMISLLSVDAISGATNNNPIKFVFGFE